MSTFYFPNEQHERVSEIEKSMEGLIVQKNYPCVAAIQSFYKKDYRVGLYKNFGQGTHSYELGRDLLRFRDQQKSTQSPFLSFWAVFDNSDDLSEAEFERGLWRELSYMTSYPEFIGSWDPHFSSNPEDKNFCFSLDGTAYYVVGLHPHASRLGRRFPQPTLIFNIYDQFRDLADKGQFFNMVKTNRQREKLYQGNLNPMVEAYGETWESIQFSGQNNSSDWKCPFQFGLKSENF